MMRLLRRWFHFGGVCARFSRARRSLIHAVSPQLLVLGYAKLNCMHILAHKSDVVKYNAAVFIMMA